MKKLLAILVAVAVVGICSVASAEVVLPDEVLGELYAAAGGKLEINDDITLIHSAIASQSNLGVMVSDSQAINNMSNSNSATVSNSGNSAVALQSNIGVAVAIDGNAYDVDITNSNSATVTNYDDWYFGIGPTQSGAEAESLNVGGGLDGYGGRIQINDLDSIHHSAAALQSNIAAIGAGGAISCSDITNSNSATVTNINY